MSPSALKLHWRLRLAGILVVLGLAIELATLFSSRAIAFIAFVGIGCVLLVLGVLVYLWSLVTVAPSAENN